MKWTENAEEWTGLDIAHAQGMAMTTLVEVEAAYVYVIGYGVPTATTTTITRWVKVKMIRVTGWETCC